MNIDDLIVSNFLYVAMKYNYKHMISIRRYNFIFCKERMRFKVPKCIESTI